MYSQAGAGERGGSEDSITDVIYYSTCPALIPTYAIVNTKNAIVIIITISIKYPLTFLF